MHAPIAGSIAESSDTFSNAADSFRSTFVDVFRSFPDRSGKGTIYEDTDFLLSRINRGMKMRIHSPGDSNSRRKPYACILYLHGGWVPSGDFTAADDLGRGLAVDLNVKIAMFNYSFSPENCFPDMLYDCVDAYMHLRKVATDINIDPERIYIAGESCGGCLSVSVPLWLQDNSLPQVAGMIAINPVFDMYRWVREKAYNVTMREDREKMYFYTRFCFGEDDGLLPKYASPLLVEEVRGLPPAVFWAASIDPSSDDVKMFSTRMKQARIPVFVCIQKESLCDCYHYRIAMLGYRNLVSAVMKLFRLACTDNSGGLADQFKVTHI